MSSFVDNLTLPDATTPVRRWASRATNISIANTLTQVVGATLAANRMAVGTLFRVRAMGLLTNTTGASTSILTLRITATSLSTPVVGSWSVVLGTTARTDCPFSLDGMITVISLGATGTAWGMLAVNVNTTTALVAPTTMITAAVTIDTTASRVVELACISGASTTAWNFTNASIEIVNP
jgi:hypothetical protein